MRIFTIDHVHRFDEASLEVLSSLRNDIAIIREEIMTLSAEVQSLLDKARQNRSLVGSVDHGVAALRIQIGQLNDKLNAIPVAPAPGISQEDKAALLEAGSELDASAETLKNDIPANVVDQSDEATGGAPKPLAGTGEAPPPDHDPAPAS